MKAILTSGRPIFYVPGAVNDRVALAVPRGRPQGVALLHAVQAVGRGHVAARLQIADLHAADEAAPRAHAQPNGICVHVKD